MLTRCQNYWKDAGINDVYQTVYELTCSCLIRQRGNEQTDNSK